MQYILIFAGVLFRILYSEGWMKRESGESPEQSRCCEFYMGASLLMPLFFAEGWEGDVSETSQKTCKTKSKNCPFEESGRCAK